MLAGFQRIRSRHHPAIVSTPKLPITYLHPLHHLNTAVNQFNHRGHFTLCTFFYAEFFLTLHILERKADFYLLLFGSRPCKHTPIQLATYCSPYFAINNTIMSLKSSSSLHTASPITSFPREIHLNVLTFLRATDLSSLQRTCRCFNNRDLIVEVVEHAANHVVSMMR